MSAFSFAAHLDLFDRFVARHQEIVDRLEQALLNVQGKATHRRRDRPFFERAFDDCLFGLTGLPATLVNVKGQLRAAQVADGLASERRDRFSNDLDPLELVIRAYDHWDRTRWPGRSGRLTFARCLFAVCMLRQLEQLTFRLWDDESGEAGARLRAIQQLLDGLNHVTAPFTLVRDARWLVASAQSPLTPDVAPYFQIAKRVATLLPRQEALEVHVASVQMTSGHLRSQIRYGMARAGKALNDPELLAFSRNSNAMDLALIVQDLVPVLEAYERVARAGDGGDRLRLADAILQGLSADPELLLARLDLLAPYTIIEDLFVASDAESGWRYTELGRRHLDLLAGYGNLIDRVSSLLAADISTFDPASRVYSPLGIVYGFSVDMLSNIAMARLVGATTEGLTFEDTFASANHHEQKLARAAAWESLPSRSGEGTHFEHSLEFATEVYERLLRCLRVRVANPGALNASRTRSAKLYVRRAVAAESVPHEMESVQALCFTSDVTAAANLGAVPWARQELERERREGGFLASVVSGGHLFGLSKMVLTAPIGAGRDAIVSGIPAEAASKLRLTWPGDAVVSDVVPDQSA